MNVYRSTSLGALLCAFFLMACTSKEAAPAAKNEAPAPPATQTAGVPTAAASTAEVQPSPAAARPANSQSAPRETSPVQSVAPPPAVPAASPAAPIPESKALAARESQAPAAQNPTAPAPPAPAKPAPASPPAKAPENAIILKASLGGVRFEHKSHSEVRHVACESCHHASRPEKPATLPQQACRTCHTSMAAPPMKTKLQAVFHNPTGTAGTCIDCHKTSNTKGLAAPVKCLECHKKENK